VAITICRESTVLPGRKENFLGYSNVLCTVTVLFFFFFLEDADVVFRKTVRNKRSRARRKTKKKKPKKKKKNHHEAGDACCRREPTLNVIARDSKRVAIVIIIIIIIIFNPARCMRGETFFNNLRSPRFIIKELPSKKAVREKPLRKQRRVHNESEFPLAHAPPHRAI